MRALVVFGLLVSSPSFALGLQAQGLPRHTEKSCVQALNDLAADLLNRGYIVTSTECVGTNEDVGGFVPVLMAQGSSNETTEYSIGRRHSSAAACDTDLKLLLNEASPHTVLEAKCLEGEEIDFNTEKTIKFYQAWLSEIVPEEVTQVLPEKIQDALISAHPVIFRNDQPDSQLRLNSGHAGQPSI